MLLQSEYNKKKISAEKAALLVENGCWVDYGMISQMPVVSSQYWNMVHGGCPEDVRKDEEGLQIMRVLGRNMAWLIQSIEAGKASGITVPEMEKEKKRTNFIR